MTTIHLGKITEQGQIILNKGYDNMSLKDLTAEYNKRTHKNIKTFPNKVQAIEKLKEWDTLYSSHPYKPATKIEPVLEKIQKCYTPKQLEVELNIPAIVIRRKLRKLFPEMAKQGAWKITEDMLGALK